MIFKLLFQSVIFLNKSMNKDFDFYLNNINNLIDEFKRRHDFDGFNELLEEDIKKFYDKYKENFKFDDYLNINCNICAKVICCKDCEKCLKCINCVDCNGNIGCKDCSDCDGCIDCEKCVSCQYIRKSKDCKNVSSSNYCNNCENCYDCDGCDNCENCYSCVGCENCDDCKKCENCQNLVVERNFTENVKNPKYSGDSDSSDDFTDDDENSKCSDND